MVAIGLRQVKAFDPRRGMDCLLTVPESQVRPQPVFWPGTWQAKRTRLLPPHGSSTVERWQ